MVSFFADVKFSDFGQKPWTIVRRFDQNFGHSLRTFCSSHERAMKLKPGHSTLLEMGFCLTSFIKRFGVVVFLS